MNEITNNKLLWMVMALGAILVAVFVGGPFVVDRIAQRVINKMQKEYSPGPYAPGFDPDRVDPRFWRDGKNQQPLPPPGFTPPAPGPTPPQKSFIDDWNGMWERNRQ